MTPNAMARAIILDIATRLYGAEDPALADLADKAHEKIPDHLPPAEARAIAVAALMQMLAFPAPGSEELELDGRWFD